ncbi:FecR family protein [Luteimonas aquatica]|uniref:FecR family protein n=1 Tax=Luteimonas aquatica TaxID=450364 RepID=UPI001F58FC85|nr:FecR domain-containing protein [Luteimonas aquatica]
MSMPDPESERLHAAAQWLLRLNADPEDERTLQEWLAWCEAAPEHRESFERIQRMWQLTGTAGEVLRREQAPAAYAASALVRRRRGRRQALAAGLAVLAGLVGWWVMRPPSMRDAPVLSTPVAINASSSLPDGSRVDLGARSRLVLRYDAQVRRVVVEAGEAYFQVTHDPKRPFVVEAGGLEVTAVGTAFNVHTGADRVQVTVSEGRVRLQPERTLLARLEATVTRPEPQTPMTAGAGEAATFSPRAGRLRVARADPRLATSWRGGVLKFVDEPLGAVIADLNRYSARPIVLEEPALAELRYTGTVFTGKLDNWLDALETSFPVRVARRDADVIAIDRRRTR